MIEGTNWVVMEHPQRRIAIKLMGLFEKGEINVRLERAKEIWSALGQVIHDMEREGEDT